jgi:hypothetical protein
MERGLFQMSKFRGSKVVTAAVVEMARLVRGAAAPAVPGEKVPHAIARAAQRLGLPRGRVASFWYGKARTVTPEDLERARDVAARRSKDVELLRNEHRRALRTRPSARSRKPCSTSTFRRGMLADTPLGEAAARQYAGGRA